MKDNKNQDYIEKDQEEIQTNSCQEKQTEIAIIGMACRFPGAQNHKEFWENIKQGRSSIREIPQERWDWKALWGDPQTEINKSNSKWGGFIADVDAFDAGFFSFSPREAETMDPQQRIMLELSWSCFQDAGICPSQVSGKKIGVYVGVFNFDYKELQEKKFRTIETYHSTGTASAVIANRVSHYFNLKGPSFPIDAACSSSLIAIHTAMQSLHLGECSMALAGGINLLLTPTRHISFSKTGMLSPTGSCKTFDESADGYVRSEGAGVILLKPLENAIADGDSIYGILKGSAVNHNGKTHTLTYPSPDAQADVIVAAHKQAKVAPESISYIEAHGTGTPKGDPIEFQGLLKAFATLSSQEGTNVRKNYCGLGSVKTNIGHLEAAAGIAGVIKVLLSMKNKQLPGLQNFKQLNHRIASEDSPFYFLDQLQEWKPLTDENNQAFPRRAGISSFGFGGANAHVVLEEAPATIRHDDIKLPYYLICLSAKTEEALRHKEEDLKLWLEEKGYENKLIDISATLLLGRDHFEIRSALVARNAQELQEKLKQVLEKGKAEGYFTESNIGKGKQIRPLLEELGKTIIKELHTNELKDEQEYGKKLMALAELYANGQNLDWEMIFPADKLQRINLPTYPFARDRYWIPDSDTEMYSPLTRSGFLAAIHLHPLLQQNTSDLSEQRFSSTFTGQEFFLADHVVKGQKVLPGVAYLEMARAAVEEAAGTLGKKQTGIRLKNVVWARPIAIGEQPVQVHIGVYPEDNGDITYEVYSESEAVVAEPVVHSQGSAVLSMLTEVPTLDLKALQAQCNQDSLSSDQCYEVFKTIGLDYGPGHQGIEMVHLGLGQVLAKLSLPAAISDTKDQFILNPSLLDAALQASLMMSSSEIKLALPFALQELEILGKCTAAMWALIRYSGGGKGRDKVQKLDIDLCDEQGNVCVRMKGLSSRVLAGELGSIESEATTGTLMLQPYWQEQASVQEISAPGYAQHVVILCEQGYVTRENIKIHMHEIRCISLQVKQKDIEERFQDYAIRVFEEIKSILKDKPKGKVLFQIIVSSQDEQQLFSGLSGLLKTAQLENPKLIGQLIEVESGEDLAGIVEKLKDNSRSPFDNHIRYQDDKRYVVGWSEIKDSEAAVKIPWKDQGVYLITGGAGGLGFIFAKEIARKVKAVTLIITGRSPLNENKQAQLQELEALGAKVAYKQVDVTLEKAVVDLIQSIWGDFGNLSGIIHCAGIIRDNFLIKKTKEELLKVLAPKVTGLVNLDHASKDLPLDLFILFSSIVGTLGNSGQADYSTANSFMDAYARYRNTLVASKQRQGQTLSINWPLWQEGGMHVDAATEQMMMGNIGMVAMQTATGIHALYQGLACGKNQVMVIEGDLKRIRAALLGQSSRTEAAKASSAIEENKIAPTIAQDKLREKATNYFKKLFSAVIKLPVQHIEAEAPLEKYGIDSIMVMQMTNQLEKTFGSLSKTLFFEYQNIQELTGYFLESYRDRLVELLGLEEKAQASAPNSMDSVAVTELAESGFRKRRHPRFASLASREEKGSLDIAIIGISGRYPQANNIHEFWKNLREGKDCITEIPKDRWDHSLYFDEDKNKTGKAYSKWGGFLEGVDQFDPLFFNISPREAETMDPQERLFLECVFETLEDAGYTREALGQHQGFGLEGNVGVYVGVMYEEYQLYAAQEQIQGRPIAFWGNPSSIANRVSYFCNFHGPSMAVDTMCSSSLTAIHLACQSLQRSGCELAIAGGVNVSIHPNKYLFLSQGKFVSSKGRCESFGQGGDGYVPGEGVGAVLLKPLSKAIADGDNIYGIIKATAINHGGKTNGYTVPNPNAQASVIGRSLKETGINPRTISYIEAHGTGTSLGDPIEIAALTKTFHTYTKDKQFCAIGSAKSNIGHCESAAGIAGVTKVLLQLKYRQLVPSLHSETLNSNIDFSNTPFRVQQELAEWKRPVVEINGETRGYPRIAGISSFGAGGSNAHVVIEEYILQDSERLQITITSETPVIIILSARNKNRLNKQVQQLLAVIKEQQFTDESLADMAYTLQVGREAMEERLGLIVGSIKELEEKLKGYVEGQEDIEELYHGQVKRNKETMAALTADEEMQVTIEKWIQRGKYAKLLDLWVQGLIFDWNKLYGDNKPRRISLPTYPFARERYWIPDSTESYSPITRSGPIAAIHPLVQENTSDLSEQRFSSTFTGQEFFLADHVVKGQRVLPGVAYLEMARAAVKQTAGGFTEGKIGIRLKNVVWARPIAVGERPVQVHIGLFLEDNGDIAYEIYGEPEAADAESVVYGQGSAVLSPVTEIPTLDLPALRAQCSQNSLSSSQCYEAFRAVGFDYGPGHQGIEMVYVGLGQVLAKLTLPSSVSDSKNQFVLHPSLMDAALQASLMMNSGEIKLALPFALKELEILGKCDARMWVLIRCSEGSKVRDNALKLDIDLCDEQGNICVRMKGFSARVPASELGSIGTLMLQPCWQEQAIVQDALALDYAQHLVILCELGGITGESIETQMGGARCLILESQQKGVAERFQAYANQVFEEIQSIFKEKANGKELIQIVVSTQDEQQLFTGLSGLLKTARIENPKLIGQLIEVEPGEDAGGMVEKLKVNSRSPIENHIRYQDGKRYVAGWSEVEASQEIVKIPWKDRGIYLITGGAGELGLIFAKEIAYKVKDVTLILTGRSQINEDKQVHIKELQALGAKVVYKQVDVTQEKAVLDLIQSIKDAFGSLNGIIHSAGINRDNFFINKTKEELQEVLAPKVTGLVNLDQASKDLGLDFFILFSSIAGTLGNTGQADYSTANAFMDAYAEYRNILVNAKQRQGQTLSVNWPLWKEGGMHVDAATEQMMLQNMGMVTMQTLNGIQALYQGLASGKDQVMVMEGKLARMKQKLLTRDSITAQYDKVLAVANSITEIDTGSLLDKVQAALMQTVSRLLKVKFEDIDADTELNEYGFDSITFTEFTNVLNQKYMLELVPTIFFEYSTLRSFAAHLIEEHSVVLAAQFRIKTWTETSAQDMENQTDESSLNKKRRSRFVRTVALSASKPDTIVSEPIAIVGMSGTFPMARDVNEFWRNLVEEKDCISEIPEDRWDWREYYGDPTKEANKTNIKWGGFICGVDEFDPLFFGISPREAQLMDPQQRLLMTYVWKVIEDAGYAAQSLGGTQTGIFVGTGNSGYNGLISKTKVAIEGYSSTGMVPSVGPNRMSYFLNLHGPSEPIETACSSSLVAIHRAVSAIENGHCEMAIAGGVNTLVTPEFHISFNKAGMLCEDGRCKTFSDQANGYVRSEGVGMLFLKRLKDAEQDGDHIYGVIRGTAENHGGRANSLTAPNPKAQAELLKTAYIKAGIDPKTVTYIEAHGTGTALGDPIEIKGLKTAFKELYQATGDAQITSAHCGLGSVKSNIGHLELAAGMAGVIKVLLQFKHKTLVKSLHSDTINPYIQLKDSPFYIVQETKEWKSLQDVGGKELPRRAGVSSFGFGGTNAHVVIEEYIPKNQEGPQITITPQHSAIIVLSAKNEERLKEQAQQLLIAIQAQQCFDLNLDNMAYTLQVGREAMEERLGLIVGSIKDLQEKLKGFVEGQDGMENLYRGQVKHNKETLTVFAADEDLQKAIDSWINKGKYAKLLDLWVKGLILDWNKFYGDIKPHRISLPTYPFARERYWVPKIEFNSIVSTAATSTIAASIHPLLHRNTSSFSGQRFSSIFTGQEFFLTEHVVKGRRILPGVALLEMARAAIAQAAEVLEDGKTGIRLTNVVWAQPIIVGDQPVQVHIRLFFEENGEVAYEIYSEAGKAGAEPVIHSQGNAILSHVSAVPFMDIAALKAQCSRYDPKAQGIEEVYTALGQILTKISLPSTDSGMINQFVLPPDLLGLVLQASSGLEMITGDLQSASSTVPLKLALPSTLKELEIFRKTTSNMWALIRYSGTGETGNKVQKLDIDLCDDQGTICLRMKGMEVQSIEWAAQYEDYSLQRTMSFLQKQWEICSIASTRKLNRLIAILTTQETRELATQVAQQLPQCKILDIYNLESQILQSEQEWKTYDGCIDLTGCGKEQHASLDWLAWLQQLIEQGHKEGLMILGVTKGLESYQNTDINLSGASRAGLYRMLQSEYSHLWSRHMDVERSDDDDTLARLIASEFFQENEDAEICYRDGKRYRAVHAEVKESDISQGTFVFPTDHVLWITGGTRGLGYLCAEHFARRYGVKRLVLTGREIFPPREQWHSYNASTSVAQKIQAIQFLENQGVQVEVLSVSLTDEDALKQSLQKIKSSMGPIGGIIHCAGIGDRENPAFIRKSLGGIQQVLDPKVAGLDIMYQSFQAEPLQFFILFSSVSAIIPTLAVGQCDYAMANAYMDYFAEANRHACPIISIEWPSWKETGMGEIKGRAYMQTGLLSQTNSEGLQLLDHILFQKLGSVIMPAVVNPDLWKPNELMQRTMKKASSTANIQTRHPVTLDPSKKAAAALVNTTQAWLISLFSKELKIDPAKLETDIVFQDFGMDSILLAQVITKMDRELKNISVEPSVLIEYPTLRSLATYLVQIYPEALASLFSIEGSNERANGEISAQPIYNQPMPFPVLQRKKERGLQESKAHSHKEKIAVVGMACHFPDATNIKEYWQNLKSGKDSICEVPKSRWDWEKYYDNGYKEGKSISKWGAFLDGIEEFDPGYFKISESLAPQIDPLQRQWLEVSAQALADASYGKKDLWGKRVGVFAGARTGNFANKIKGANKDRIVGIGQNFITVHLAHVYNFRGPNMVVDAACASTLAAIHLAVKSIQNGEAEIALAGGVDILLDESPFITLSAEKILSPDGRCKTFDAEANGIGLGEGCGVLVLKPLQKAIQDHNKIYGVIDGSAINSDGNTMGITTPNPDAQRELIKAALIDANISPETITYVETHGTGTLIGDPIELKALTQIFSEHTAKKQFCGVGSVKSNIGHLLSAAGAAGIIKVLLSITQQELPPTLHCNKPNPRFNFNESPLYPVQSLKKWTSENYILRAGISAFGLGGNNVHIIVSDEGIPNTHKASLEPRGEEIVFNRKHYWPEKLANYSKKNDLVQEEFNYQEYNEANGFIKLFKIVEV